VLISTSTKWVVLAMVALVIVLIVCIACACEWAKATRRLHRLQQTGI
jgi:hypothetical protein